MKNLIVLLLLILLFSSFCKKENPISDSPLTVSQILTDGAWIQAQYLEDSDGDGVFTDESRTCELDNTWVFDDNASKSMSYNDIGDLCAPQVGPITIEGFWDLKENDQVLNVYLSHGSIQDDYTIASISDSLLVLHYIDPVDPTAAIKQKLVLER